MEAIFREYLLSSSTSLYQHTLITSLSHRGFAAVADPDGYHIQLMSQSIGQDDKLRKQLEALMSTPSSAFTLDSSSLQNRGDGLESITTRDSQTSYDALRFAKGGSPVSPSSPAQQSAMI